MPVPQTPRSQRMEEEDEAVRDIDVPPQVSTGVPRALFGSLTAEDSRRLDLEVQAIYEEGRRKLQQYEIVGIERILRPVQKPGESQVVSTPMEGEEKEETDEIEETVAILKSNCDNNSCSSVDGKSGL